MSVNKESTNEDTPALTLCLRLGMMVLSLSTRLISAAAESVSSSPNTSMIVSSASAMTHSSVSFELMSRRNFPMFYTQNNTVVYLHYISVIIALVFRRNKY